MAVAQLIRERRGTVARTLRESFGVGLSELGDGLTWGEARDLIAEASADPSTALGAELAGWAYPASMPQLLTLAAAVSEKALPKVMPWSTDLIARTDTATPDEVSAADAELTAEIIFTA